MIFIDFDFYLLTTPGLPGCNYTWIYTNVILKRVVDSNPEKLGAYRPGQYQSSEEDFNPDFKKYSL